MKDGGLVPEPGKTGVVVWKMRSPYVFVGGRLEVEGARAKFSLSWDGTSWQEIDPDFFQPSRSNQVLGWYTISGS